MSAAYLIDLTISLDGYQTSLYKLDIIIWTTSPGRSKIA